MNPCSEREELLSAYLDGELGDDELGYVVSHLEGCRKCLVAFRAIQEARTALRLLPEMEPPAGLVPSYHVGDGLSSYLDGELTTREQEAVGRHLEECSPCRAELQEVDAARTAIRALPRLEPPTGPHAGEPPAHTRRRLRAAVVVAAAGAVAAVSLVFALGGSEAVDPLDLGSLANRHSARVSVESGFAVIPAGAPVGQP